MKRMCMYCHKYVCECWKRTHKFTDWYLDLTDNTYLYSYNLLLNNIILETVVDEHDDHQTIQTLVQIDLY